MREDPAVALLAETYLTFIRRSENFLLFEQSAYEYGFEIIAAAMSAALEEYDDELSLQRPATWRVKDRTPRSPVSEVGQLSFSRRIYIDEVGERRCMLDEVLDLPKRARLTPGAFDKLTGFGVETSYHAAARLFNRHIGCGVTAPTVMNALRESEAAARRLFEDGEAPDGEMVRSEVVVEADGVWVPRQVEKRTKGGRPRDGDEKSKGFEVKAMVAYSGKERKGASTVCRNKVAFDAVTNPDSFWKQGVAALSEKFELGKVQRFHLGADGGAWCSKLPDYVPHAQVDFRLDQFHVNEAVVKAVRDRQDRAEAFHLLYSEGPDALVGFMRDLKVRDEFAKGAKKRNSLVELSRGIKYIEAFKDHIDANGLSMETMESANAHVIGSRMKSRGGAWSRDGGNAMARARAHVANGGRLPRRHYPPMVGKKGERWALRQAEQLSENCGRIQRALQAVGPSAYEPPVCRVHMPEEHREQLEYLTTASNQVHSIPSGGWTNVLAPRKWSPWQTCTYSDDGKYRKGRRRLS